MAALAPVVGTASVDLFGHVVASRAFAIGLLFGAFAYFASGLVSVLRRRIHDAAGLEFAAALVLAVRAVFGGTAAPLGLILGIGLLAIGGALAARSQPRIATAWYVGFVRTGAMLVPGALVLVAAFPLHNPSWVRLAVGIGVVVAGPLVHDFDSGQRARGAPFLLLAVAAVAVYYTLPDTELPLVMLGCALPLMFLSVPQPLSRLGPAGSAAAVGVFMWIVGVGGRDRAGAVVAAVAALGLLLVEPLARRVPRSTVALGKRRRQRTRGTDNWLLVIGVAGVSQLALGAYCATIAGRENDVVLAALMAAPALVLLGAAAPMLLPVETVVRRPAHGPRPPGVHRRRSRAHGHHH
jgi:hypothetical protein